MANLSYSRKISRWLSRSFGRFAEDRRGVGAIEFGFTAPMIAVMLVGMLEVGSLALDRSDMHTAARSGVQYFMSGGSNHDRARNVVIQSWDSIPDDAVVSVEPFCLCGSVEHQCHTLCANGDIPTMYARFSLSGTIGLNLVEANQTIHEIVRVR